MKKYDVTPTYKAKRNTIEFICDSIIQNVSSPSLNQSLKGFFNVVISFPGADKYLFPNRLHPNKKGKVL